MNIAVRAVLGLVIQLTHDRLHPRLRVGDLDLAEVVDFLVEALKLRARQEIAEGSLVSVPLAPRLYTPLEVIVLKDKFRSRLVNTFADFVTAEIARLSSSLA